MNIYVITFPFKGTYHFIEMTANQLANGFIEHTDDFLSFTVDNEETQGFYKTFDVYIDGKNHHYGIEIANCGQLNIYDDEDDGTIVEKNVLWQVIKIKDKQNNERYNITDNL
jgi:hypothetical protein